MQEFPRKLLTEWRKLELPFEDQKIIIAVSGGADSCSLAYLISDLVNKNKFRNQFFVAHFNHKLRGPESDTDARFVKRISESYGFEFIYGEAPKDEISSSNTEGVSNG